MLGVMSEAQDKLFDAAIEHAKTAFHDHQYEEAKKYLSVSLQMIPIKKMKGRVEPKVEEVKVEEKVVEQKKYNYGLWVFVIVIVLLFFEWMGFIFRG